jgi:hypothetical protein
MKGDQLYWPLNVCVKLFTFAVDIDNHATDQISDGANKASHEGLFGSNSAAKNVEGLNA